MHPAVPPPQPVYEAARAYDRDRYAMAAAAAERQGAPHVVQQTMALDAPFSRGLRDAVAEATNVSRSVQAQLNMLTAAQAALDARVARLDEDLVPNAERRARAALSRSDRRGGTRVMRRECSRGGHASTLRGRPERGSLVQP